MLGWVQVMQRDRIGSDDRQEQPTSARVSLSGSQLGVERLTNEAPGARPFASRRRVITCVFNLTAIRGVGQKMNGMGTFTNERRACCNWPGMKIINCVF